MMRRALSGPAGVVAYALAAVAVTLAWCAVNLAGTPQAEDSPATVPPCVTEDSAGPCVWDASSRGNGHGVSFTRDAAGHVTYAGSWHAFRDVDGHTGCRILVGPTSLVRCADGFETTS